MKTELEFTTRGVIFQVERERDPFWRGRVARALMGRTARADVARNVSQGGSCRTSENMLRSL